MSDDSQKAPADIAIPPSALRDSVDGRALAASLPRCKCGAAATVVDLRLGDTYRCDAHWTGERRGWVAVPWDAATVARLLTPLRDGAG